MSKYNADKIKIDSKKFKNWCAKNGLTFRDISAAMGCYDCFISRAVSAGEMPERKFNLFLSLYNEVAETFTPDAACSTAPTYADCGNGPYSLSLSVAHDKVRVGIMFRGSELYGAYAGVKGKSELDLVQAISYAAHMCYKMAEQKKFENS